MNKPLFALGISLLLLGIGMLYGVSVAAQQPDDAPLVIVRMPTATELTPDQVSGVADTLMTITTLNSLESRGEVVGYVFDASIPIGEGWYEYPVLYFMELGKATRRMCGVFLYFAAIEEWTGDAQAYVMGEQDDTNCTGPIPVFYSE